MGTGITKAEVVQGTRQEIKGKITINTITDTNKAFVDQTKEAKPQEATRNNTKVFLTEKTQGFIQGEMPFKGFKTRSHGKDLRMQPLKK